ncbi:zinc finger protein 687a-like isoform X2 [Mercenaria mercenaria]|nr:zinc finger protein 687a-like isoform X2 [Mercenaria mercenaria]
MTDVTDTGPDSKDIDEVVLGEMRDQSVDDSSNVRIDSQLGDQSGEDTCSKSAGDQFKVPHNQTFDASQSREEDSPTKRFNEFTVLIGETEASMRDKLSELTLPGSGDSEKVKTDISVSAETQAESTGDKEKDDRENTSHKPTITDAGSDTTSNENTTRCEVRSEEVIGNKVVSEGTGVETNKELMDDTSANELQINEVVSDNKAAEEVDEPVTVVDDKNMPDKEALMTEPENKRNCQTEESSQVGQLCSMPGINSNDGHSTSQSEVHSLVVPEDGQHTNVKDSGKAVTDTCDMIEQSVEPNNETVMTSEKLTHDIQMVESECPEVVDEIGIDSVAKGTSKNDGIMDTSEDVELDDSHKIVDSEAKDTEGACDSTVSVCSASTNNQDVNGHQLNRNSADNEIVSNKDNDVEMECQESMEGVGNNFEELGDENEGKDSADTCNESDPGENDAEESFMIIDVRSLTENSGIDNFSSTNENVVKENNTGMELEDISNKKQLHENQDSGEETQSEISTAESVTLEKSQSLSNLKSKRKSPHSVRRITDLTDSEETVSDFQTPVTDSSTPCTSIQTDTSTIERSDMTVTALNVTSSESESLPVISNTFSMKDFSSSASVVKNEPPDDGMYGVMQNSGNVSQIRKLPAYVSARATAVNLIPGNAVIHKGQILSQGKPGSSLQKIGRPQSAQSQKLVISKVPPMVCPTGVAVSLVSSAPSSLTRYQLSTGVTQAAAKVQAVPRSRISGENTAAVVALRNLAPRHAVPISVQNGNVPTILTSALPPKDQSKEKTTSFNSKNLSTINIHSVGVARITDLIARKNPIPTFKPDPIPENLKSIQSLKIYPCYECGDSFHFEKSLRQHLGRCSMKISYKCEECKTKIMFTNKCQLLNHLRSHLNIEKTQAVPIHIKSDSIEIETNYKDINVGQPFEWYKESNLNPNVHAKGIAFVSSLQCIECGKMFSDIAELQNHVKGDDSKHYFCEECPIYVNSKCSLQAHIKLHELNDIKLNKSLSVEQWSLLKTLSCPECGRHFWSARHEGDVISLLNNMALHLKNVCFHLSRLPAYKCSKCMKMFQSFEGLRNHLNTSLEHYYKCGLCPMALKSLKSLESHHGLKHKPVENSDAMIGLKAKIIYRCHVCDTLIDDKSFLFRHIDRHLEECKKHPETHYHCLQCGQIFMEKKDLLEHYTKHTAVRRQFWCTFCSRDRVRAVPYIMHMLKFHTSTRSLMASRSIVKFCDLCGLVCVGEHMFQKHVCLGMRNASVVIGDKSEKTEVKERTKTCGETEMSGTGNAATFDIAGNKVSTKCVACSKVFDSIISRQNHLRDHRDIDMIFICKFCDMMNFKSYHELRSHEIACTALSHMPKEKPTSDPVNKQSLPKYRVVRSKAIQNKHDMPQYRKILSKDELIEQKIRMRQNDHVDKNPYTDGVELTPEESKKKSKRKQEVVEYHMCDKCDAVFTRKSKQEEHIKSEHGIHPCHLCGLMHESQSSLKKHLMVDHEGKRMLLYCGICKSRKIDKAFSVREKIIKHFKVKHRMKVIDESKIITQLPGLPEPVKETTPESQKRKLSSSVSPETSVKKLRIEGESDFKCAKCLFTCDVKSDFRQHILEHKAADTYQCFECGLCFAVLPSLKKHVFMVHKVRDFNSYMEENKIEEPTALEDKDVDIVREPEPEAQEAMEESSEEEQSGDPLECKVCYKSFESEKVLKSHMRTHGMAFIRKSRRRAHTFSPRKKSGNDAAYSSSQEEGKKEGLILKIKRLKPEIIYNMKPDPKLASTDSVEIDIEAMDTEAVEDLEPGDADADPVSTESVKNTPEMLKNREKSVEKSPDIAPAECSVDIAASSENPADDIDTEL